jgi:penicillin-insensitive murein DD-endopeptidase
MPECDLQSKCRLEARCVAIAALWLTGCLGTPTPLAPQLRGSIGLPHSGVQTEAVELPKSGAGFARFRPDGAANWGQPHLVEALTHAALLLTEWGAGPLVLGDLSAKWGGRIPRHKSHRTGRDVDLLWQLTTLTGAPIRTPGFIRIGEDGLGTGPDGGPTFRLDVPRQWRVVRSLLLNPTLDVQWMFCSEPVEALLIEYARARHEPDDLIWRAETVLQQPADSLPHDDHIHMRIACRPDDTLRGCAGGGPQWEWSPPAPSLATLTVEDLEEIGRADPLSLEPAVEVIESERLVQTGPERRLPGGGSQAAR